MFLCFCYQFSLALWLCVFRFLNVSDFSFRGEQLNANESYTFFQISDILASVTDAIQAFYPFLQHNKDLVMDVLRKVSRR